MFAKVSRLTTGPTRDPCRATRHVAIRSSSPRRAAAAPDTRRSSAQRAVVWIVEDDPAFSRVLAEALRTVGYEPLQFPGGRALLDYIAGALASKRPALHGGAQRDALAPVVDCPLPYVPRLLVSDIRMPGPSGVDLACGLQELPWLPPIILMTAFGGDDVRRTARQVGAIALFDKPFDVDELCALIHRVAPIDRSGGTA